jgi:stage II sporulation protein D
VAAAVILLGLYACTTPEEPEGPREGPELAGEPTVRVLLVEGAKQVKVGSSGPCQLQPSHGEPLLLEKLDDAVTASDGTGLQIGDRKLFGALSCRVVPGPGSLVRLDGKPYLGEVELRGDKGLIRVIDHVRCEDYVAGVVGGEMPLSWPDAAVKAQSIAARTYVVWHWKTKRAADHDVTADTRSQVFTGVATDRARALVQATEGRVLTYNWRVFEAFFSSTCAGETASADWVFGGPSIPPLQGTACGACTASKHANWTKEIPASDLEKLLAPVGVKGPIKRVDATPWPRGGYVKELTIEHAGGVASLTGPKARTTLQLKSAAFTVAPGPNATSVVFTGHGWGHGVGLCQWGAKGCAEAGLDEDAIMAKYYPGAKLAKLY